MLPYSCIDSIMYDHTMNVYYANQSQDESGAIVRTWILDRTERGIVHKGTNRYEVGQQLNTWNDTLIGQSEEDLRIDSDGDVHSPSEVLVTFVNPEFNDTVGPRSELRSTYELRGSTPVTGPFGEVLHFDILLVRSIAQNVLLEED